MKEQHIIKLTGCLTNGTHVNPQTCPRVAYFSGDSGKIRDYFKVELIRQGVKVTTPKGIYQLKLKGNIYIGVVGDGIKMHVSLKKMVGKLIYWA